MEMVEVMTIHRGQFRLVPIKHEFKVMKRTLKKLHLGEWNPIH
jgi:hypothetical protein